MSNVEAVERILLRNSKSHSGWIRGNCPFCLERTGKEDRKQSFGINASSKVYMCHRCAIKGRLAQTGNFLGREDVSKEEPKPSQVGRPQTFVPLWVEPGLNAKSLSDARSYLRGRGLGRRHWQVAQIGVCSSGYLSNRIVVPIIKNGEWLGWVARDWTGTSKRKYLYPLGMKRAELIWEGDLLNEETDAPLMVVEGVFDALPYYGKAVALLGKPSHKQVEILKNAKRPLVIVLDGDAWEESFVLAKRLALEGVQSSYVKLKPGTDPGDTDREWLLEKVRQSITKTRTVSDGETKGESNVNYQV